jgi:uncharacterized protein
MYNNSWASCGTRQNAPPNLRKHGVDFADIEAFEWERAVLVDDRRRGYGEPRHLAYGLIGERVYVVVFVERDADIRLISLRKANRREVRRYEQETRLAP